MPESILDLGLATAGIGGDLTEVGEFPLTGPEVRPPFPGTETKNLTASLWGKEKKTLLVTQSNCPIGVALPSKICFVYITNSANVLYSSMRKSLGYTALKFSKKFEVIFRFRHCGLRGYEMFRDKISF